MKFKNYRNSYTNEDKIYSRKNIADMSVREAFSRKNEIMAQHNSIGIPSEGELQSSPNAVWVESYTREDGTEVRGYWRSHPEGSGISETSNSQTENEEVKIKEQGSVTGGASEVNEINKEKDVPEMTKSAELQENVIKNMPIWEVKSNPEQEYYRIAFELKEAQESGKVPEWINEHNDVRTLEKIGNEEIKNALKEKIIQGAKENGDIETLNNLDKVYVVTAKMDSEITKDIVNNPYFKDELKNKLEDISKGKYKDSSFSINFPNSEHKIVADFNKDFSTHNTIGNCDVHNLELGQDGYIHATIIDYYNFDRHNTANHAKNAYIQQQNGHLKNYAIMIPIRIKVKND